MLRSMTGFGRCFIDENQISQQWEIRSVNSRYLDIKWRLPPFARYLESRLEKLVRKHAVRGRVEISLALQFSAGCAPAPVFDSQMASAMLDCLKRLAQSRNEDARIDYTPLLSLSALWGEPEGLEGGDAGILLEQGLEQALFDWNEARLAEGAALGAELDGRIKRMGEWLAVIREAAPGIREDRIRLLQERLAAILASSDFELSEDRFLQEVVILTDRLDVSEEIARLEAHLARLRQLVGSGQDAGRKLDFTLQECFREINTCGNKIQDASIAQIVVDFKNELEKCREQAQNLE
ncbi:MAG: YicC family protein [Desulfovibrio sp.]|nr:YicC family protein [Desulfovibrio sp.]